MIPPVFADPKNPTEKEIVALGRELRRMYVRVGFDEGDALRIAGDVCVAIREARSILAKAR